MNYVMEKLQGDKKEIEVWGTNKPWLNAAAQIKNANAAGKATYIVRDAGLGECLPKDKFLGNIVMQSIPTTGKTAN